MSALDKLKALPQTETMGGTALTKLPIPGFVSFGGSAPPPFSVTTGRTANRDEAAELQRLLEIILADVPDDVAEDLAIACASPDSALTCFRALAAEKAERDEHAALYPELNKGESTDGV